MPLLLLCPVQLRVIILITPLLILQTSWACPLSPPSQSQPQPWMNPTTGLFWTYTQATTGGKCSWSHCKCLVPNRTRTLSAACLHCVFLGSSLCVLQNSAFSPQSSDPHSIITSWLDPVPHRENWNQNSLNVQHQASHPSCVCPVFPLCLPWHPRAVPLSSKASLSPVPLIPSFPTC